MAGATATKFKKNDTAHQASCSYQGLKNRRTDVRYYAEMKSAYAKYLWSVRYRTIMKNSHFVYTVKPVLTTTFTERPLAYNDHTVVLPTYFLVKCYSI